MGGGWWEGVGRWGGLGGGFMRVVVRVGDGERKGGMDGVWGYGWGRGV